MYDKAEKPAKLFSGEPQVCIGGQPMEPHAVESNHVVGAPRRPLVPLIFMETGRDHMQILFLAHRIPYPPDKGETIRSFHELRYLAGKHKVDLFCFADSALGPKDWQFIQGTCRHVYVEVLPKPLRFLGMARSLLTGRPLSFGFFYSRTFEKKVRQALRRSKYDLIFVFCSAMGQYLPDPAPAPVFVDFVDADSEKFRQYARMSGFPRDWLYAREARTVAAAEQALGRIARISIACAENETKQLRGTAPEAFKVEVVSNGMEVPDFSETQLSARILDLQPFAVFVGTMSYWPNSDAAIYFAREIFPLVRRRHPELKFVIVGRDPGQSVRSLTDIPGVIVTGWTSDVYQYVRHADVSVAPLRISQGYQTKITESLIVGTPVVTTSRAMAAIGLSECEGLFAADSSEQFADRISSLLQDLPLRRELRARAAAVRRRLSWDIPMRKLEDLLAQAVDKSPIPAPELVTKH